MADDAAELDITAIGMRAESSEVAALRALLGGGDGERKSFKDWCAGRDSGVLPDTCILCSYYDNYHAVGVSLSFDIDKDGGEVWSPLAGSAT